MADYYFVEEELELIKRIDFSKEVFEVLKRGIVEEVRNLKNVIPERFADHLLAYYPHEIEPLYENLPLHFEEPFSQKIIGITIRGDVVENPEQFVRDLNSKVYAKGYQAFLTVSSSGSCTNDNISLIEGTDQTSLLDFIRLGSFSTAQMSEKQIKEKLTLLIMKYECEIIGVGNDWAKIYIPTLPKDISQFLTEVKEFAADTFTNWGDETKDKAYEKVKNRLIEEGWIYLWWED